jgi:integrase
MLRDRDLGVFVEPSGEPLNRYLDRWLDSAAKPKLRSKTFRDYENLLARYVRPELGPRPLAKISPLDIQALYGELQSRELSASTVRYTHAVLRSALQQAVKWRLLSNNPADAVELPKQSRKEIHVLSADQTLAFLEAATEDRLGSLFALAATSGLRPSEYLALKWMDFDESGGTVRIVRTLEWLHGGGWQFVDVKRPKSRRTVKLHSHIIEALLRHRCVQEDLRATAGLAGPSTASSSPPALAARSTSGISRNKTFFES